ncbi:MAG: peptidoglycan DD-metalloendopeptidase family protein [Candidatus Paceibacteria bacterium]
MLFVAIVIPVTVSAGFFDSLFSATSEVAEASVSEVVKTRSIMDVPVLTSAMHLDPNRARGGGEVLVNDGVLVSTGPVGADVMATTKRSGGEISVYIVREGDSLSQIAEMYGVTANTILWANDIPRATAIRPGDTLVILPVAGVRHVVKTGDTIATIAQKYKGDAEEIELYNQLESGQALAVGSTLVIPGGAMHTETVAPASGARVASSNTASLSHPAPGTIKTQGIHGYNAIDLAGAVGTPIKAAAAGEVIVSRSSGWNGGYGNYIVIRHANGVQTLYAHLSRNDVGVGASVAMGQVIGAMGNTGRSTGPHLHFEVRGARNPF